MAAAKEFIVRSFEAKRLAQETLAGDIAKEAEKAEPPSSPEQAEAGNYAKGHVHLHGFEIAIENAKGSTRSGKNKKGEEWSVKMPAHYGYIKGTTGKDKDHLDVYIGDSPESSKVFVVNQQKEEGGGFDEHKVMLGFETQAEAVAAYDKAFNGDLGPKLRESVVELSLADFKDWLENGDTTKPIKKVYEGQSPKEFIKTLSRKTIVWDPAFQIIRNSNGSVWMRRYDAVNYGITMFVDLERENEYGVRVLFRGKYHGTRSLKDESGFYTWFAPSWNEAVKKAKDLVQKAYSGEVYEGKSPKEFLRNLPIDHELDRLHRIYVSGGLLTTAMRIKSVKFLVTGKVKSPISGAFLDGWIAELAKYEHRPGYKLSQELLRVLRRANKQLSGIKEGRAREFIKSVAVYGPWFNKFYRSYVETALWSSTDDNGEPLDQVDAELADQTKKKMEVDCRRFYVENKDDIETGDVSMAGHDFWLTRNGHGSGFWDGDWPEEIADRLTASSKRFGEANLYVGEDGQIYHF